MSKFDRAYEIFKKNNDRKVAVAAIAKTLEVTEANASVYFYKCVKKQKAEDKQVVATPAQVEQNAPKPVKEPIRAVKRTAVPSKVELQKYDKLQPMTEAERLGYVIPDFVPDFLLSDAQRRLRAKQRAAA